jgi:hypothetical protein
MARNFTELQAKMDPASRAANIRRVRDELRRMALAEPRRALDASQSSTSRIDQKDSLES